MASQNVTPFVRMVGIGKRFGPVEALKNIDFTVERGEIVGLVGDNGAGKSTLINILSGVFQQDEGCFQIEGREVRWNSPREARSAGIETVYQHLSLVPLMSISRVFFLGKEPLRAGFLGRQLGFLDKKRMDREAQESLYELGIESRDPNEVVANLSGGEKQAIAIGRALHFGAKTLLLDEPTAALSVRETEKVLDMISGVREKGIAVVFVTHNIYHV
jgi:simple sugar transport system ATP-binding protein